MGICTSVTSRSRANSLEGGQAIVNRSCSSSSRRARGQVENRLRDLGAYLPLYKAAVEGKWRDARIFLDQDPEALTARITIASETALHIAVGTGQKGLYFVKKLIREMSPEDLALTDQHDETPFSIAAIVGNVPAAKMLRNRNPDLPNISGKFGFPIHKAARYSHKEMVEYLTEVTRPDIQPNPFTGEIGGHLLIDVIAADFYEIALQLIEDYPEIATVEVNGLGSPLSVLARKPTVFSSGRVAVPWWKLYNPVKYFRKQKERNLMEDLALKLVRGLCQEILELDDSKVFSLLQPALHDAAKLGIPEIIEEIVIAFPSAIWFTDKDNYNVFQLAILNRRENVFNLLYQLTDFKYIITRFVDHEDNNMLHLVGKLPSDDRLSLVSGPALLVQREMQWFKEVSRFIYPAQKVAKNKEGKTPEMVFREGRKALMKDGAKWMKQSASSAAVFATLIATVAFAGGMHVPGGTNREGLPSLLHQKAFSLFVAADALSLLLSVLSIFFFLFIITARYAEKDFLYPLPQQLMFGIGCLICSIIIMMVAFGVALYLSFRPPNINQIYVVLYVIIIVILGIAIVLVTRIVRPINGSVEFGEQSDRVLH